VQVEPLSRYKSTDRNVDAQQQEEEQRHEVSDEPLTLRDAAEIAIMIGRQLRRG